MSFNTLRTVAGFIRAYILRLVPVLERSDSLDNIYNYLLVDSLCASSGQPSETQFQLIKDAGYGTVVNLAPTSVFENSVIEEAQLWRDLDVRYIHIPVDFKNPTTSDFEAFILAIADIPPEKLWVHCAANMRVSAFIYRYRRDVLGISDDLISDDLYKIWTPTGVWKQFIAAG